MIHSILLALLLTTSSNVDDNTKIDTWCEIKFTTVGQKSPVVPDNVIITLDGEGYNKSFNLGQGKVDLSSGKLTFPSVPTGKSMKFTIKWDGVVKYSSSYKFSKPGMGAGVRGKKAAGYIGSFSGEISSRKITYSNKYY